MTTSRDTTNRLAGIASNCREQQKAGMQGKAGTAGSSREPVSRDANNIRDSKQLQETTESWNARNIRDRK